MTAPSTLSPTYTCTICRRTFSFTGQIIVGQSREERMARVAQQLATHLGNDHKEDMAQAMMAGSHHVGWLITSKVFKHNDPDLMHEQLVYRMRLRRLADEIEVTDERIEKQVQGMFGDEYHGRTIEQTKGCVVSLMKQMRDAILEVGQFDPLKT